MADYSKKVQSANKHLQNETSARFVHIDGSKPQVVVYPTAGRLLRVVIGTAGIVATIRDGSKVIGQTSSTSAGTLNFGVYVNTNITIDVASGTGSMTVVFDN